MAVGAGLAAANGLKFSHPKRQDWMRDDFIAGIQAIGDFDEIVVDHAGLYGRAQKMFTVQRVNKRTFGGSQQRGARNAWHRVIASGRRLDRDESAGREPLLAVINSDRNVKVFDGFVGMTMYLRHTTRPRTAPIQLNRDPLIGPNYSGFFGTYVSAGERFRALLRCTMDLRGKLETRLNQPIFDFGSLQAEKGSGFRRDMDAVLWVEGYSTFRMGVFLLVVVSLLSRRIGCTAGQQGNAEG